LKAKTFIMALHTLIESYITRLTHLMSVIYGLI